MTVSLSSTTNIRLGWAIPEASPQHLPRYYPILVGWDASCSRWPGWSSGLVSLASWILQRFSILHYIRSRLLIARVLLTNWRRGHKYKLRASAELAEATRCSA